MGRGLKAGFTTGTPERPSETFAMSLKSGTAIVNQKVNVLVGYADDIDVLGEMCLANDSYAKIVQTH